MAGKGPASNKRPCVFSASSRCTCAGRVARRLPRLSCTSSPTMTYHIACPPYRLVLFIRLDIATEIKALRDDEQDGEAHHAEELEVDPGLRVVVIGDVEIDGAERGEERYPYPIEPVPDRFRQRDVRRHHALQHRFAPDVLTAEEDHGEEPVHTGRFPFDEGLVLEKEREPAQHHDQPHCDPLDVLDLAMAEPRPDHLDDGGDDGHGGRDVDVVELVGEKEEEFWLIIVLIFHMSTILARAACVLAVSLPSSCRLWLREETVH